MTDPVDVPQICLVIELAQPRKEADGSITPAEIESIRANLPARYFDIRVVTPEDETDDREGEKFAHCLVLGTGDIAVAIARFREEHPEAKIWAAEQADLDQGDDSPMGYLDQYEEILVVGGAKVQKGPGRTLQTKPN